MQQAITILTRQYRRALGIGFALPAALERLRVIWPDALLVALLMAGAFPLSFVASGQLHPVIYSDDYAKNILFDADPARVVENMTSRATAFHRFASTHPLFSLIAYPPVYLLKTALGVAPMTALRAVFAVVASLWVCALFALLRLIGCRRFDAALFTLLGACTSAAMFWFVVPETYSFGSVTILLALVLVALSEHRRLSSAWYVFTSALSLSVTVTNWMAGILATLVNHPWKRTIQITANALLAVVLLWAVEKIIFPASQFFLQSAVPGHFMLAPESAGPLSVLKVFFLHSIVMPAIDVTYWSGGYWYLPVMTIQRSTLGSGGLGTGFALLAWSLLLALGLWSLLFLGKYPRFRVALGLTLLGQLALHTIFGWETFLYSLDFVPLLIVVAALSTLTPARFVALSLAGAVTMVAAINNSLQFQKAVAFIHSRVTQAVIVAGAKQERSNDFFPRDSGHVVLAMPGSQAMDKAYHEPGGGFSPSVGSFGASVWVADQQGKILAASDWIPMEEVSQKFDWSGQTEIPAIVTETAYYHARWSSMGPGRWKLNLRSPASALNLVLVIRSVGPAGGPIRSLDWNGRRLLVNDRWSIMPNYAPTDLQIGNENDKDWKTARSGKTAWKGDDGWGYARLALPGGKEWEVVIEETSPVSEAPFKYAPSHFALELEVPDARFAASLKAQVAHLMMGLVGREARPGDPMIYPFAWARGEAYILAALARAGQIDAAKELSRHLAENDFFGGLGPEADTPGLEIWALADLAARVRQPEFDRWLWPHIDRKAKYILEMLSPARATAVSVSGPIVPTRQQDSELSLVSDPARNGLIVGKKDSNRSFMYVNAASYRGLLCAAEIAERVNRSQEGSRYRAAATAMKDAWVQVSAAQKRNGVRPDMNGLVPTWLADSQTSVFFSDPMKGATVGGEARQYLVSENHLALARAHQQLFAGRVDRVWTALEHFWSRQESPGLFVWGETSGEEALYDRWEKVRGWTNRSRVTPHYRTAAEMLLLQLDMLAYADERPAKPAIVIGAGIPPAWLDRPMSVRGLSTQYGNVDWIWNGKEMRVKIRGSRVDVRLGKSFAGDTPLRVEYFIDS